MEEVDAHKGPLRHCIPRCSTEARRGKKQLEPSRAKAGPSTARNGRLALGLSPV